MGSWDKRQAPPCQLIFFCIFSRDGVSPYWLGCSRIADLSDPPALDSQNGRITGVSHHGQPLISFCSNSLHYNVVDFTPFKKCIYGCKLPLSTAFTAFHEFCYAVFSFSFVSRYFLISLLISPLTHLLFKSMLFNFYILVDFSVFLLCLTF